MQMPDLRQSGLRAFDRPSTDLVEQGKGVHIDPEKGALHDQILAIKPTHQKGHGTWVTPGPIGPDGHDQTEGVHLEPDTGSMESFNAKPDMAIFELPTPMRAAKARAPSEEQSRCDPDRQGVSITPQIATPATIVDAGQQR
jgi:hypothetical protein